MSLKHHDSMTVEVEDSDVEVEVFNHVTVIREAHVRPHQSESYDRILAGDGSTGRPPEAITTWLADNLRAEGYRIPDKLWVIDVDADDVTRL